MINPANAKKLLPLLTLLTAIAALTLGTPKPSWADSLRDEMSAFHRYLNDHPRVAADLERDPGLANSSRYLHEHDHLREFLHNHPQVRQELSANPGRVMGSSSAWNRGRSGDYRRYDDRPWYWPWGRR